ncbi:hypothetical protein DX883_06445 [Vibrio fluvialis]|nr:hypothetical protein [Vibrio fluvialis]
MTRGTSVKLSVFGLGLFATLISVSSYASFQKNEYFDSMYNKNVYERYTTSGSNIIGFRCDSDTYKRTMYLTFGSQNVIGSPNQEMQLRIKIDGGNIYDLTGRMYSSSYESGVVENYPKELLYEIKQGSIAHLEVYSYNARKIRASFKLSGSSNAVNDVSSRCDVTFQADPYKNYNEEIMRLQRERDHKIYQLEQEYAKKIAEVRARAYGR